MEEAAFLAAVERTIRAHAMLAPGDAVVVAVSGGPDSMALLDALVRLAPTWRLRLHAVHVDHGLRPDSGEDAAWVADRVRAMGLLPDVVRVDAAAHARAHRLSLEAAARQLRYRELERARRRVGAARIAVGHHRDDVAETVLLRLCTGAGSDGLAGIPPVRGAIVRPLIERSRAEILAYLAARGLPWREDPSNRDLRFPRNRIRHELLPWLERHVNPRVRAALARTAALLRDEVEWLEAEARRSLEELARPPADGSWLELDAAGLMALPAALQRRVLRLACWRALRVRAGGAAGGAAAAAARGAAEPAPEPDEPPLDAAAAASVAARLDAERIEQLRALLARPSGAVDLAGGVRVVRRGGRLKWLPRGSRVTME